MSNYSRQANWCRLPFSNNSFRALLANDPRTFNLSLTTDGVINLYAGTSFNNLSYEPLSNRTWLFNLSRTFPFDHFCKEEQDKMEKLEWTRILTPITQSSYFLLGFSTRSTFLLLLSFLRLFGRRTFSVFLRCLQRKIQWMRNWETSNTDE